MIPTGNVYENDKLPTSVRVIIRSQPNKPNFNGQICWIYPYQSRGDVRRGRRGPHHRQQRGQRSNQRKGTPLENVDGQQAEN